LSGETLLATLDVGMRSRNQFEAFLLDLIHQADIQGIAKTQGATNTAAWLRDRYRLPISNANQSVKLATWLHSDGEQTATAMAAGDVNPDQARVIANAVKELPAQRRDEGEQNLIHHAHTLGPRELRLAGEHLFEVLDPDGADKKEAERLKQAELRAERCRSFTLTDNGDGRVRVSGWLTHKAAAIINAALDPLCRPGASGVDLDTATQRRADALVAVCGYTLAGAELPDNGGDRPQVVVTMDLETLREQVGTATLDDGARLSATEARLAACDARVIPVVLGGKGQVLDVGRERRTVSGPLRRALVLRDGGCTFPSCDRPAQWADAHHIIHWGKGGSTCLSNLGLLCEHHHWVVHRGEWEMRINPADGRPEFLPPSYVDMERKPMRNHYHRRN
jgi:Domain of unknown function (DUF222)